MSTPAKQIAPIGVEAIGRHGKSDLRLWLRLLTCSNMIKAMVRQKLRGQFDVTLPRFDYMAALYQADGPLSMGELSAHLMVSNGNITGVTERLLAEGLIMRDRAAHDRRTQIVALTPKGREVFAGMAATHAGWIEDAFSQLSQAEIATLMGLLGKLKQSVAQAEAAGLAAGEGRADG